MSDLLPPNAPGQLRAQARQLARINTLPVNIKALWNPDTCPEEILPWLAWACKIEYWNPAWPVDRKRAVVKAAWQTHALKGTPQGIKTAVAAMGVNVDLRPWYHYGGPPATFEAMLWRNNQSKALDSDIIADVVGMITATKPVSKHFTLRLGAKMQSKQPAIGAGTLKPHANLVGDGLGNRDQTALLSPATASLTAITAPVVGTGLGNHQSDAPMHPAVMSIASQQTGHTAIAFGQTDSI
ncbi:MAG: phage tail protein I, partial [Pseudomonadota bacterium]